MRKIPRNYLLDGFVGHNGVSDYYLGYLSPFLVTALANECGGGSWRRGGLKAAKMTCTENLPVFTV